MDRYRERRSPDRERSRYPPRDPPAVDTFVPTSRSSRPRSRSPGAFRRRSRTPPRWETDNWRSRPRSPPRRYDERPRSPRREYSAADAQFDDGGRPPRARSPPGLKRNREYSPPGRRSPPPAKRERLASPRREYVRPRSPRRGYSPPRDDRRSPIPRARSRSPLRDDRPDPYAAKSWRRRTPSPRGLRAEPRYGDGSGRVSATTSRRSSPRPRAPAPYGEDERAHARSPYLEAEPTTYEPSPRRNYAGNGHAYDDREMPIEAEYRTDERDFPPPSGPRAPPSGPSGTPVSMSAHNRPGSASVLSAPSQPRGGYGGRGRGPPRGDYRDYSGPPPARRGSSSYGAPPPYSRAPSSRESPYPPRESYYDSRGPPRQRESGGPPFNVPFRGSSNSTSTTYPRTQRFNTQLNDLPTVKDGGERRPELYDTTKADKLEEEAARLRKLIDEKEAKKRQGMKEWSKLESDASTAALKSELAEGHLRQLNGESEGTMAAF